MSTVHSSGAVADPCCAGSRGASFGTPCYYICVTLTIGGTTASTSPTGMTSTAAATPPPCSLLVLTAHAVYHAALYAAVYLLITRPLPALTAYVMVYLLVPASAASAVAKALQLPDITRRLFGRLMDAYRSDNYITYAAPGAPGSLKAALTSTIARVAATTRHGASQDDATAQADRTEGGQHDPVHIFAVHPAGVISRSAFGTFAARGWSSPVASLRQVRLAVGSQLFAMPMPLLREFLLACGCIPADRTSMLRALSAGRSLAVTPGGWREGEFFGSYKLVVKQRRGFVQLAQQSGAMLVPVLCLGEQDIAIMPAGAPGWLLWFYRFLQTFRPHLVKVVFGKVRLKLTSITMAWAVTAVSCAAVQSSPDSWHADDKQRWEKTPATSQLIHFQKFTTGSGHICGALHERERVWDLRLF